jgi:RimJ/RimL family protein N-acetyltransferase
MLRRMQDLSLPYSVTSPRKTARLVLRPFEPGDLEAIHDLFSREDVCRYLPWEPMDLEQARSLLERRVERMRVEADGDGLFLAAVEAATGRVIGEFMLRLTSVRSRQGEVGWSIHPDVQGRGLATEGAREMLRIGFAEVGLHRIMAEADARNPASLAVMARIGMRREAELIESELAKGEWATVVVCAVLEPEWRRLPA